MEEKSQSLGIITLGYGLLLGVVVIIFSLLLFLVNVDKMSPLNYLSFVFVIAGIIYFQFTYRNKYLGGYISYGKAFSVGFLTIVYYSVIITIFTYIYFVYIDPGAIEAMKSMAEEKYIRQGLSDQEIDRVMIVTNRFQTPVAMTLSALFGGIAFGAVICLITSIFVKKEDPAAMPMA